MPSTDAEAEYLLHVKAKALNIAEKPRRLKAKFRLKNKTTKVTLKHYQNVILYNVHSWKMQW